MESIGSYMGAAGVDMAGLDATELRLGLPGTTSSLDLSLSFKSKRPREEDDELSSKSSCCSTTEETSSCCNDNHRSAAEVPPPAKSQVVGWPPVQSFRVRCSAASQGKKAADGTSKKEAPAAPGISSSGLLVKVSMDGAPYLRKIDLGSYKGYKDLRMALDAMFGCFSTTASVHHQVQNIMTYEDKDGDWMLVGDVPWEMFTASCKRLRIMKGSSSESRA